MLLIIVVCLFNVTHGLVAVVDHKQKPLNRSRAMDDTEEARFTAELINAYSDAVSGGDQVGHQCRSELVCVIILLILRGNC